MNQYLDSLICVKSPILIYIEVIYDLLLPGHSIFCSQFLAQANLEANTTQLAFSSEL